MRSWLRSVPPAARPPYLIKAALIFLEAIMPFRFKEFFNYPDGIIHLVYVHVLMASDMGAVGTLMDCFQNYFWIIVSNF